MTAAQRITAARAALILDQPFFGVLALQLAIVEDTSCKTAWTDGRSLGYNPAFIDTLTPEQVTALLAHEVMHCACGHPWRRDGRDHDRFNQACDYAINAVIRDAGFTLPDGSLLDDQYSGRHAEWIYDRLAQPQLGQPQPQPQPGQPQPGEVRDAPADSDEDGLSESDWQQVAAQAQQMARGSLSAGAARGLTELRRPIVDWRSVLRRFMQDTTNADYSWTRPNVRYLASGLFLPSLRSPQCGRIVVAVDTSGSIDRVLLDQFAGELRAIVAELQPRAVSVIYCDSEVTACEEFGPQDAIELSPVGGGGTAFAPVFDYVASLGDEDPAALIYFTDLDGAQPETAPAYPVLWACSSRHYGAVNFGEVVPLV